MGALGGLFLASLYLSPTREVLLSNVTVKDPSVVGGAAIAFALVFFGLDEATIWQMIVIPVVGAVAGLWFACVRHSHKVVWGMLKESVFLTAKATAMVCWLFVGSWTFASVFSYLGGHDVIEQWFVFFVDVFNDRKVLSFCRFGETKIVAAHFTKQFVIVCHIIVLGQADAHIPVFV